MEPTPGRVVWYWRNAHQEYPLAAHIAFIHPDNTINLMVIRENGSAVQAFNVPQWPQDEDRPDYPCWDWMPYQKGQAAKTEQLEQKLAEADNAAS